MLISHFVAYNQENELCKIYLIVHPDLSLIYQQNLCQNLLKIGLEQVHNLFENLNETYLIILDLLVITQNYLLTFLIEKGKNS